MNITEVILSSYIFKCLTQDDKAYHECVNVNSNVNLSNSEELNNLIKLLRKWGCRNFQLESDNFSKVNILKWYDNNKTILNNLPSNLLSENIDKYSDKIKELFFSIESIPIVKLSGNKEICVGPVPSSKILFVLKPNFFAIWDSNIRTNMKYNGINKDDYFLYLKKIRSSLIDLKKDCSTSIDEILKITHRRHSFYPKLIEEYYFVKYAFNIEISDILKIIK